MNKEKEVEEARAESIARAIETLGESRSFVLVAVNDKDEVAEFACALSDDMPHIIMAMAVVARNMARRSTGLTTAKPFTRRLLT